MEQDDSSTCVLRFPHMPVRQYRKDKIDEPDELEESDKFLLEHEQPGLVWIFILSQSLWDYRNQYQSWSGHPDMARRLSDRTIVKKNLTPPLWLLLSIWHFWKNTPDMILSGRLAISFMIFKYNKFTCLGRGLCVPCPLRLFLVILLLLPKNSFTGGFNNTIK